MLVNLMRLLWELTPLAVRDWCGWESRITACGPALSVCGVCFNIALEDYFTPEFDDKTTDRY